MTDTRDFLHAVLMDGGGLLEVRAFGAGRPIQRFYDNVDDAANDVRVLDQSGLDVFVGMAPRDRESGTADDVSHAYVVSADCDTDEALIALEAFPIPPSVVIASGGRTERDRAKLHAHWFVPKIDANALVELKVDLARALGSDAKIVDAPRIMRIPGTHNRKPGAGVVEVVGGDWEEVKPATLQSAARAAAPRTRTLKDIGAAGGSTFDLPDTIEQGQRDDLLFKYGARLRGRGLDHDEILVLLERMNAERVDPPLPERDLRRIARSVCRYEPGQGDEDEPDVEREGGGPLAWAAFRDQSREPVSYFVEGLIAHGGIGVCGATAKAGKTWFAAALAISLVAGVDFLGKWTVNEPTPTLYVALEGSDRALRARIGALARGMDLDPDGGDLADLSVWYKPARYLNLTDQKAAARFVADVLDTGARYVIIDVARAAARIRESGEGVHDLRDLQANLRPLTDRGIGVLLLHHAHKVRENTGQYVPPLELLSGSGDWGGMVDVGFVLMRDGAGWTSCRVLIDGRDIAQHKPVRVVYEGDGSGPEGLITYLDTLTVSVSDSKIEPNQKAPASVIAGWLAGRVDEDYEATTEEITSEFGISTDTLRRRHADLRHVEKVEIISQPGGTNVYRMPEASYPRRPK